MKRIDQETIGDTGKDFRLPQQGTVEGAVTTVAAEAGADDLASEPCERCGAFPARHVRYMWVVSLLVVTRHATPEYFLCRRCSTRQGLGDLAKSAIFGWWGIPWGILTLGALWTNVKGLARWSTVPKATIALLGLLSLGAPIGLGAWLIGDQADRQRAESTGDWVEESVAGLTGEGHELSDRGDSQGALAKYREAYARHPDSSVINSSIASTLRDLGRHEEAVPFARRAAEHNPLDADVAGLYALLLVETGDEGATAALARLDATDLLAAESDYPEFALYWAHDWARMRTVAEAHLAGGGEGIEYWRVFDLLALTGLGELEAADELRARIPQSWIESPMGGIANEAHELRVDAARYESTLRRRWVEENYGVGYMEILVEMASRSPTYPQARDRVTEWLRDEAPEEVWAAARPWFEEDAWPTALDRHLRKHPCATAGWQRVLTMDPIVDRPALIELLARLSALDKEAGSAFEPLYLYQQSRALDAPAMVAFLQPLFDSRSSDLLVALRYSSAVEQADPGRADAVLAEIERRFADDASAMEAIRLRRAELLVARRKGDEAEALLQEVQSAATGEEVASEAASIYAELALLDGRRQLIETNIAQARPDRDALPPALLLRWIDQLASGEYPTYFNDTNQWLQRRDVDRTGSGVGQGILLAQGKVSPEWARQVLGSGYDETFRLVALVKAVADGGELDRKELQSIAETSELGFAARTARALVERLDASASA